jgi:hypothetical protein
MRVNFVKPHNGPKNLLAEAEVFFDAMTVGKGGEAQPSPFSGMKLVGFSIWKGDRGVFVTFPNRAFGAGSERRYFDFLRSADSGTEEARSILYKFKRWIADEYKEWASEADEEPEYERTAPNDEEF